MNEVYAALTVFLLIYDREQVVALVCKVDHVLYVIAVLARVGLFACVDLAAAEIRNQGPVRGVKLLDFAVVYCEEHLFFVDEDKGFWGVEVFYVLTLRGASVVEF